VIHRSPCLLYLATTVSLPLPHSHCSSRTFKQRLHVPHARCALDVLSPPTPMGGDHNTHREPLLLPTNLEHGI